MEKGMSQKYQWIQRGKQEECRKKSRFLVYPEPICLSSYPDIFSMRKNFVKFPSRRERDYGRRSISFSELRKMDTSRSKGENLLKKKKEAKIRRRKMKEPIRNLKSYLLTSVNNEKVPQKTVLPPLFEVLETVKDAWPPPLRRNHHTQFRYEDQEPLDNKNMILSKTKMKEEIYLQFPSPLINRRFSMPEELMRKYSISKEKTSEESEASRTLNEITSSASTPGDETCRENVLKMPDIIEKSKHFQNHDRSIAAESNAKIGRMPMRNANLNEKSKRVTQNNYYSQGKSFIKFKEICNCSMKGCCCTCIHEKKASNHLQFSNEDTNGYPTTESKTSSSLMQLPKQESSSEILSSESDYIQCTCRDLESSKETSFDIFHSGKSTLSQTISDKSTSTQDSTVSMKSVSTRGSTATDNSDTTTPDDTSAKEMNSSNWTIAPRCNDREVGSIYHRKHKSDCPLSQAFKNPQLPRRVPQHCLHCEHCGTHLPNTMAFATNLHTNIDDCFYECCEAAEFETQILNDVPEEDATDHYTWAKLSQEELYMMQQLRHQELLENTFTIQANDHQMVINNEISDCNNYLEQTIMVPRYSAIPRTISMLVNMSSTENSMQNSDSDNQSLADSLEDQPVTHARQLYFDTKKESKPVRGDVNHIPEIEPKIRVPKGKAFFVSIDDPFDETEMSPGIKTVPQPPEKIKNQISERHSRLFKEQKHSCFNNKEPKRRKVRSLKSEKTDRTIRHRKENLKKGKYREEKYVDVNEQHDKDEEKVQNIYLDGKKKTEVSEREPIGDTKKTAKRKRENREQKERQNSKIPVFVNGRISCSSGDDLDRKQPEILNDFHKNVETTQVLEIPYSDTNMNLKSIREQGYKNQSHFRNDKVEGPNHLMIPPLVSNERLNYSLRQPPSKLLLPQVRKSPISKFRQRFEVIPEEKSSSLSSADEKSFTDAIPKQDATVTSKLFPKNDISVKVRNPKVTETSNVSRVPINDKHSKTLPFVKNADQRDIILFSSKSENNNYSKGRDALIAMNRDDFNRLAKGWMNFYKLSEISENSDGECKAEMEEGKTDLRRSRTAEVKNLLTDDITESESKQNTSDILSPEAKISNKSEKKQFPTEIQKQGIDPKEPTTANDSNLKLRRHQSPDVSASQPMDIDGNIKIHSFQQTIKKISPDAKMAQRRYSSSLPELRFPSHNKTGTRNKKSTVSVLPKVGKYVEKDDSTDSDSTDYLEPPSPRVPPLPMEDFPSDLTISSSESDEDAAILFSLNKPKTRETPGKIQSREAEITRSRKPKNSGWSVTVAGTVELSKSAPDLEMRLTFPMNGGPSLVCQSDSGFAEDSNYSKLSESLQDLDVCSSRNEMSTASADSKRKWTVRVENPKEGGAQNQIKIKSTKTINSMLPDLDQEQSKNTKKVLKNTIKERLQKEIVAQKLLAVWPKIQKIIQKEFTERKKLEDCLLYIQGNAISLKKRENF